MRTGTVEEEPRGERQTSACCGAVAAALPANWPERTLCFAQLLHANGGASVGGAMVQMAPGRVQRWTVSDGKHLVGVSIQDGEGHVRALDLPSQVVVGATTRLRAG